MTLTERLPPTPDPDALVEAFYDWAYEERGVSLYPAQEEALLELVTGSNVILSTPTGSGKSLVAVGAHAAALQRGTARSTRPPIKALVSEKFFQLIDTFGADKVGMLTGDAAVNEKAPDHLLHGGDPRQHRAALRGGRRRRLGRDGRVPLLRRSRPRVGLAGAADRAAAGAVPADERHARRCHVLQGGPDPPDGPRHRGDHVGGPARATALPLRVHAAARDDHRAAVDERGARLRRALHPGVGRGAGAGTDERERHVEGRQGGHRGAHREVPVHRGLRQDALAAGAARHRRAPRGGCCRGTGGWWRPSPRPGC